MLPFLLAAVVAATTPPECAYDRSAMLALSPRQFDQDMKGGWRPLGDKPACLRVAADLLAAYRKAHRTSFTPGELHTNYWHQGQVLAGAGDYHAAVPLLMAGVDPDDDATDFTDYAIGTIAFLQHDRRDLELARARLAVLPQPDWWAKQAQSFKARFGYAPSWPPNLDVLDGLLACFDRPYIDAYSVHCRPTSTN